jgi:hypothetical protein
LDDALGEGLDVAAGVAVVQQDGEEDHRRRCGGGEFAAVEAAGELHGQALGADAVGERVHEEDAEDESESTLELGAAGGAEGCAGGAGAVPGAPGVPLESAPTALIRKGVAEPADPRPAVRTGFLPCPAGGVRG